MVSLLRLLEWIDFVSLIRKINGLINWEKVSLTVKYFCLLVGLPIHF